MPGKGRIGSRYKLQSGRIGAGWTEKETTSTRPGKRNLPLTSVEELFGCTRPKRPRKLHPSRNPASTCDPSDTSSITNPFLGHQPDVVATLPHTDDNPGGTTTAFSKAPAPESKCWIDVLPHELLLKIFGYLPLGMLLHTIPHVCKKWEILALDWTLWKAVENLTIKNMVISTSKLRTLLRTIPRLKKLELILRNDTEELLHELIRTHHNLEVLKLDRCYRSTLQMNILSQTVTSILEFCPRLKTVMLTDTYFHSKTFYKCLARKFRNIERINVTCTTKSEMDVFMDNLKENVSGVEFQRVPMMGRAEGKQIYWGPILGLVVRPIPTSPFHRQYTHDNYPTYAF